jgi:hypothetical protein
MDDQNPFLQFTQSSEVNNPPGLSSQQSSDENPFNPFISNPSSPAQQSEIPAQFPGQINQSTFMDNIDIINRNFANVANGGLQMLSNVMGGIDKLNTNILSTLGIDREKTLLPEIPQSDIDNFQQNLANQQAIHKRDYQQAMQNSPISGFITDVGSKIGATITSPGTQPILAAKALDYGGRLLQTAAASFLSGGQEYVNPGESRIGNAINSGYLGAAFQSGGEVLSKGLQKGAKALFTTPIEEAVQSADKGLLTTPASVTGNSFLQGTEDVLGRLPVIGAKRGINKQVDVLKNYTNDILNDIGVGNQSKVDLGEELNNAIKSSYDEATINTNKAYSDALDFASKNKIDIPLQNTQTVAKDALAQVNQLKDAGILSADMSNSKAGQVIQDLADLPTGSIPAKSFDLLRKKISSIKLTDDPEGLSPILKQIKSSLDTDLESAGGLNQGFGSLLTKARNVFMTEKAPFQNINILNKVLSGKKDADELLNQIVQNDRPVLTKKVMDALSPQGQQSFSKAIVNKVFRTSLDNKDMLDLGKFSQGIHKLGETIDMLPQAEQMKIKGLQNLLVRADNMIKTSKLSSTSLSNWVGGSGSVLSGLAIWGFAGLGKMLGVGAVTKALSMAMTSPRTAKLLIKLAGGKLAQTGQDGIVKAVLKTILKGAIPAAAKSLGSN